MSRLVIDAFAGPGGWDLAARELGLDVLGIELDDAACATRKAAGLRTLQADVSALDPLDFAPAWGFIASAPCPAFSMAGKGEGRAAISEYRDAMAQMAAGRPVDWARIREASSNESGHLILEPLRWVLALRPRWVALEQVEPVMPLWESMADCLRPLGYSVWCDVISAERYDVPQRRRRAILLASLDGPVSEPPATHQRYIAPRRREEATESLFAAPEPERIVLASERHLLPWISMAQALGWGMTLAPTTTHYDRRQASPDGPNGERVAKRLIPVNEPAPVITGNAANRDVWVTDRPATTVNGDPRFSEPGHHDSDVSGSQQANAVRVSLAEAAVLQSFPADYPWQGTKSKCFEQVGNAVPVLMAKATLSSIPAVAALILDEASAA